MATRRNSNSNSNGTNRRSSVTRATMQEGAAVARGAAMVDAPGSESNRQGTAAVSTQAPRRDVEARIRERAARMQAQAQQEAREHDPQEPNDANNNGGEAANMPEAPEHDQDNEDQDDGSHEDGLQAYFAAIKASGTTRSLADEKSAVTAKVAKLFKRRKFITADEELDVTGQIAMFLFRELRVMPNFQEVWWKTMKSHVRKKLDERRSNCGNAIKQALIGKQLCICFLMYCCILSNPICYLRAQDCARRHKACLHWIAFWKCVRTTIRLSSFATISYVALSVRDRGKRMLPCR